MLEGQPADDGDGLKEFAEQLRSVPPWTPDPAWYARLKERLLAQEPAADEPA